MKEGRLSQNEECRDAFIKECEQKAWDAACHADYISKQLDGVIAEYQTREAEKRKLGEEAEALEAAPDHHTVDNRNKRKAIQAKRDALNKAMAAIGENVQQANRAIAELHRNVESNLALAKHAEEWEWKDLGAQSEPD